LSEFEENDGKTLLPKDFKWLKNLFSGI
jgi:hypothetical protein